MFSYSDCLDPNEWQNLQAIAYAVDIVCVGEYIYCVFVLSSHQEGILRAFEWKGWHLKAFPAHIVFMLSTGRITIIPMQWKALGRLLKPLGLLPSNHLLGQNAGNKEVCTSVSWVQVSSACSASFVESFRKMFRKNITSDIWMHVINLTWNHFLVRLVTK